MFLPVITIKGMLVSFLELKDYEFERLIEDQAVELAILVGEDGEATRKIRLEYAPIKIHHALKDGETAKAVPLLGNWTDFPVVVIEEQDIKDLYQHDRTVDLRKLFGRD